MAITVTEIKSAVIGKAMQYWPYFKRGFLLMKYKPMPGLGTMGMDEHLNWYCDPAVLKDPKWKPHLMSAVLHEFMHWKRDHHERARKLSLVMYGNEEHIQKNSKLASLMNVAWDLEIWSTYGRTKLYSLPEFCVTLEKYNLPYGLIGEEYFKRLLKREEEDEGEAGRERGDFPVTKEPVDESGNECNNNEQNERDGNESKEESSEADNGDSGDQGEDGEDSGRGDNNPRGEGDEGTDGSDGSSDASGRGEDDSLDSTGKFPGQEGHGSGASGTPQSWEENDEQKKKISESKKEIIKRQIAEDVSNEHKTRGNVPGELAEWADALIKPKKVSWKHLLKHTGRGVMSHIAGTKKTDPSRLNRDYPINRKLFPRYPVTFGQAKLNPRIAIVEDISGSMCSEIREARDTIFGFISTSGNREGVTLFIADTEVRGEYKIKTSQQLKKVNHSGGGTNLAYAMKQILTDKKNSRLFDCFFLITDGYTPWPEKDEFFKLLRGRKFIVVLTSDGMTPPDWVKHIRIEGEGDE